MPLTQTRKRKPMASKKVETIINKSNSNSNRKRKAGARKEATKEVEIKMAVTKLSSRRRSIE